MAPEQLNGGTDRRARPTSSRSASCCTNTPPGIHPFDGDSAMRADRPRARKRAAADRDAAARPARARHVRRSTAVCERARRIDSHRRQTCCWRFRPTIAPLRVASRVVAQSPADRARALLRRGGPAVAGEGVAARLAGLGCSSRRAVGDDRRSVPGSSAVHRTRESVARFARAATRRPIPAWSTSVPSCWRRCGFELTRPPGRLLVPDHCARGGHRVVAPGGRAVNDARGFWTRP